MQSLVTISIAASLAIPVGIACRHVDLLLQQEIPKGKWFCCINCKRIHSTLSKLVVRGFEKIPESLLTVVKKKFDEKGLDYRNGFDVRWRLVNGNVGTSETRLLLSQALDIFHVSTNHWNVQN